MKDWIILSLVSGILYAIMSIIMIKIAEKHNESLVLFFIFLFGSIFYFIFIKLQGYSVNLTKDEIFLILIAAFLSFLANMISLKSAVLAPNPSYASMLSRFSNVLLVTFLSVIFLGREFSLIKFIGIIIMLIGSIILML